ncbi:MAG TPA: four helix bundle protein [Terriglobales bacterium]|nr:four helix bundle protein [Terriglobales bacterium]
MSVALYKLTEKFPKTEIYGLTSQIRRAGVSVASNISEGYGRQSTGDYKRFLGMACGSNLEVQTQLVIARQLRFGQSSDFRVVEGFSEEIGKMLVSLMRNL